MEGLGVDVVAQQHRGLDAVDGVDGADAPPDRRAIEHVVVDQRCRVEQLDHLGDVQVLGREVVGRGRPAHRHAGQEHEGRAQLLAAVGTHHLHHRPHLLVTRGDVRHELAVHPLELRTDHGGEVEDGEGFGHGSTVRCGAAPG